MENFKKYVEGHLEEFKNRDSKYILFNNTDIELDSFETMSDLIDYIREYMVNYYDLSDDVSPHVNYHTLYIDSFENEKDFWVFDVEETTINYDWQNIL